VAPSLDSIDAEVRSRLARVLGRIGGKRATGILRRMLDSAEEEVRPAVLAALVQCGYRANAADVPRMRALIAEEMADVCRTLAALIDFGDDSNDLLTRALQRELDLNRERLLLLLATLYDARSLQRAQLNFRNASVERRAIALELLDNVLPLDLKQTICPLFDDLSPAECLRKLAGKPTPARTRRERRREILQRDDLLTTRWTFACALYQATLDHDTVLLPQARALALSPDPVLRETARWSVAKLSSPNAALTRDPTMLLTIEKVMILKSVAMFAHTPDDVLAEVASLLKEVRVEADEVVFTKGDLGDSLYILVDGAVKIHDGDKVFKRLSERDVFGEMAVLDPEPRSASVTGTAPSLLFRLDQAEFYELMADRVEMLRGILRLLCQRLRHMNEQTSAVEKAA
jgi:hypothetical protein